jgi:hypothetical protein
MVDSFKTTKEFKSFITFHFCTTTKVFSKCIISMKTKSNLNPKGDDKETIRQIPNRGEVGHNGTKTKCWQNKR